MSDLKNILDAVNTALGVVQKVASTPGINALPYVSTISSAVGALQAAVSAGVNVAPYLDALTQTFTQDKVPNEAELKALDEKIAELRSQLHAPLPPKENGEDE